MRLIDACALQDEYKERHSGKRLLLIDVAPTVDAVPVVRCRDCKRYQHEVGDDEYALGWCPFVTIHLVPRNGFCAWGKRKEDGERHGADIR